MNHHKVTIIILSCVCVCAALRVHVHCSLSELYKPLIKYYLASIQRENVENVMAKITVEFTLFTLDVSVSARARHSMVVASDQKTYAHIQHTHTHRWKK